MKLKNNLKIQIILNGYKSMKQFCEVHNLTYDTINRLANGRATSFHFETITEVCKALNCDVGDIFYIEEEPKQGVYHNEYSK